ncbi:uncharacterized protein VTP21DRAFT_3736 [Calcarisporiella thermophila]|uniref:uncharacterized protein n=1 Tax=Calcarisporiella thermophila TaxID=911321 RepID=UPI0037449261
MPSSISRLSFFLRPTVPLLHHSPYSTTNTSAFTVFDRNAKRLQRERASFDPVASRQVDYLKDEIAERVVDRLLDVKRDFGTVLDLGSGCGHVSKYLKNGIVKKLVMCDMSKNMLYRDAEKDSEYEFEIERVQTDEELLPFKENTFDAIVSNLSLHWVNDLPGALIQANKALREDGVFIASMFGGDTLFELRGALQLADLEREGGISPRISPMIQIRDAGGLLSRAGFTITTVDVDEVVVNYPSPFELMEDLRMMGESNAVLSRRPLLKRDNLLAAAAIYKELHGNPDGSIPASFQIVHMIGWKPSPTQRKPIERGSAKISLKDVLEKDVDLEKLAKDIEEKEDNKKPK